MLSSVLARWHVQVKAAVDKAIAEDAEEMRKAEEEAAAMEGAVDAEVVGGSPVLSRRAPKGAYV